jgi:hypothetical protein
MSVEDSQVVEDTHDDEGQPIEAPKRRGRPPKAAPDPAEPGAASDEVAELKAMLAAQAQELDKLRQKVDPVPPSAAPLPLYRTAGVHPIDVESTQKMNGARASELTGVPYDELMSFVVRAPLNVDGKPITSKRVLIVSTTAATKVAVELPEDE